MKRIASLQTMRLFASLGVFQYHLWNNYLGVTIGQPGTDFFLVLVGFVAAIAQAVNIDCLGWGKYIRGRYVRLYVTYIPLFLVALLAKWKDLSWDWALQSFLFLPTGDRLPVIGATWMLSMFMLFYFLFSLAFLARNEKVLWPVFGLWAALIVLRNWVGWKPGFSEAWVKLLFDERNLDFIFGYAAGVLVRQGRITASWGRRIFWIGVVGVVVGTALLNLHWFETGRSLYAGLPVMLFVLGLAALEQQNAADRVVKILTNPWLVWLGGTSYVLYVSHGIFLQAWDRLLPVTPLLVPLITVGGILAAAVIYTLWEEPLLRYCRQKTWKKPALPGFMLDSFAAWRHPKTVGSRRV
jgi:peptidoglycan/LPS O-acetylase OafA/YrhL